MGDSVTRARGDEPTPRGGGRIRRCRRRESFEGQEPHHEEVRFATGRNMVNPRIGSRVQQTCTVGEERTVEVVRNHADGARERLAVVLRREPRRRASRESDSSTRYDGGAIFGQTQERQSGRQVGPHGIGTRRESRRQGQEGRVHTLSRVAHPGRRDLEGHDAHRKDAHRRSRRGAAKPTAAESTGGNSPHGWPPKGGASGANPLAVPMRSKGARRSPIGLCVVLPHASAAR
jgi:hypothetical protein